MLDTRTHQTPAQTPSVQPPAARVSAEQRRRMIAEAAYYKALTRELEGSGDPVADWLEAEREIDEKLAAAT